MKIKHWYLICFMLMLIAFSVAVLISAIVTIVNANKRNFWFVVFKPLTTVLIIFLATASGIDDSYGKAILLALIASLLGDIFLLDDKKFIFGLISFLVAHILYIWAFYSGFSSRGLIFIALPLFLYALAMLKLLWPGSGKLKIPIIVYMTAIMLMTYQAGELYFHSFRLYALIAFIGALFFAFSDSVLALNKFRSKFDSAQLLILSSYYLAQWLIALSLYVRHW